MQTQTPKVIFLDAVGTLFGVEGSVGQIYAEIAQKFGVQADPEVLNTAFIEHFRAASAMAFPDAEPTQVPAKEYEWWQTIAAKTFQTAGQWEEFEDFSGFFAELYACFSGATPWFVYPDTYQSLERWRTLGIELGVISNFDSRIYTVLDTLALADFFTSITISTEVGAAKPDPRVFATALQKHKCSPTEAWHIGDSYAEDYQGACAAGIRGIWLRRSTDVLG